MSEEVKPYSLKTGNSEFDNKHKDIFAQLETLERRHIDVEKEWRHDEPDDESTDDEDESEEAKLPPVKADLEGFKMPAVPALRGKSNFGRDPSKWQHYSLEETQTLNDSGNSAAAFAFLDAIRKRKAEEQGQVDDADEDIDDLQTPRFIRRPKATKMTDPQPQKQEQVVVQLKPIDEPGPSEGDDAAAAAATLQMKALKRPKRNFRSRDEDNDFN